MTYAAPTGAMLFTLIVIADAIPATEVETAASVVDEAARFAANVLAPLNRTSDTVGAAFSNHDVTTPPGFVDAYRRWQQAGWNGVDLPIECGGMGLPTALATVTMEMWTSACMSFALGPVLTQGAVDTLLLHGSAALQEIYLPKLVSGEWTATMNLTEPQAGSDLALLTTRADRAGDGSYRITGSKIFITYGEHDLTDNIVHLVLARLPDAPPGTRGISLFLVPKLLTNGTRNAVRCNGIEHKLGIHGSPTCAMAYDGATGWLVGEEHRGLACMFTMMNKARLYTGLQGVAIAERAYQQALAYAKERRQGSSGDRGPVAIIEHADVRRNLMSMKALIWSGRALAYAAAAAIDRAHSGATLAIRKRGLDDAGLLTPIVKAYCTDAGVKSASIGVQIHGGAGYVEATGAAQHFRDARITPIYEGTNGIQAIDLVQRKIVRPGGQAARALIDDLAAMLNPTSATSEAAIAALRQATQWLLDPTRIESELLAAAAPYLRLFAITAAHAFLEKGARAAAAAPAHPVHAEAIAVAQFFSATVAVTAPGLAQIVQSAPSVLPERAALAEFLE